MEISEIMMLRRQWAHLLGVVTTWWVAFALCLVGRGGSLTANPNPKFTLLCLSQPNRWRMEIRPCPNANIGMVPNPPTPNKDKS